MRRMTEGQRTGRKGLRPRPEEGTEWGEWQRLAMALQEDLACYGSGRLGRRIARPYLMREIAPSSRIRLPIQYLNRRWYFWFWIVLTLACLAAKPRPALAAAGPIFAVNTGDSIERTSDRDCLEA